MSGQLTNSTIILNKIYQDLHDIKLFLMRDDKRPSSASSIAGTGAAAAAQLRRLSSASSIAGTDAPAVSHLRRLSRNTSREQNNASRQSITAEKARTVEPAPEVKVVKASTDDEEAFQLFEFKGTKYWKNGLQYVYNRTSDGGFGTYAGLYDVVRRKIDTSVPEPVKEGGKRNRKNKRSTRRIARVLKGGGLREDALAYLKKEGKEPSQLLFELHKRNPNGSYTATTKTMGGFTFKSVGHPAQSMTLKAKKENNANDKYENIFSFSDH
jgi:hypothetical protein